MTAITARLQATLANRYRIERHIGSGGMATVFLAEDLKHHRRVALKVLRPELSALLGAERFLKEIELTASLQHPQILPLFDSGEADGLLYYVMPYVEGESLRQRLTRERQLSIDDAIRVTTQAASALDYAHRHGVVHRDIKPENILLHEGQALIADFGIALAVREAGGDRLTQTGLSLGTPLYMSPEQAAGDRQVDARSDVYSLAAVLYEMLAGEPPLSGPTVQAIIAKLLSEAPRTVMALRASVPVHVSVALDVALAKLPADRFEGIADFAQALGSPAGLAAASHGRTLIGRGLESPHGWSGTRAKTYAALALTAGLAIGGFSVWQLRPATVPPVAHALIDVLPADEINSGSGSTLATVVNAAGSRTALAWSPDGRTLAFVGLKAGVRQLYLRDLDGDVAHPLAGTEGGRNPAFSPDGQWIAFSADGEIRKVRASGGPPVKMCALARGESVNGISWGSSRLVFAGSRRLMGFSPSAPTCDLAVITEPQPDLVRHASPQLLPGDKAVLFTEHNRYWTSGDERVMLKPLPDGPVRELIREAADARFLSTGQLVFLRQGTMFAVRFDAAHFTTVGEPVPVLGGVAQATMAQNSDELTLEGQYAVSPMGNLAYVNSALPFYPDIELVSVDRRGRVTPLPGAPARAYVNRIGLSPDGSQLAVTIQTNKEVALHVFDRARGTLTPVPGTQGQEVMGPTWSPTDDGIAVIRYRDGTRTFGLTRPGATSPPTEVATSGDFWPTSWSRDGRRLVGVRDNNLWVLSLDSTPKWEPFLETPGNERNATWSPDGRYLAYQSDEATDRFQVYVRAYPGPASAVQVSTDGGSDPEWNASGGELFYLERITGDNHTRMMRVAVTTSPSLRVGKPTALFSFDALSLRFRSIPNNGYAVSRDGQEFLVTRYIGKPSAPVTHITLILNWFGELNQKLPH